MFWIKQYLYISSSFLALSSYAWAMEADEAAEKSKPLPIKIVLQEETKPAGPNNNGTPPASRALPSSQASSSGASDTSSPEGENPRLSTRPRPSRSSYRQSRVPQEIYIPSEVLGRPSGEEISLSIPQLPETHRYLLGDTNRESASLNNALSETAVNNGGDAPAPSSSRTSVSSESSDFSERSQRESFRIRLLRGYEVPDNEDTRASYFLTEEELYERLVGNFHGHTLILNKTALNLNPKSLLIFDALALTKSLRGVSLEGSSLSDRNYLALSNALSREGSLRHLNLTGASFSNDALTILTFGLKGQKTLREIILKPRHVFTDSQIESFYDTIKSNEGLRLISWPETMKDEGGFSLWAKDLTMLSKIKAIADKGNRVAALHYGETLARRKNPADLEEALTYLQKAYDLGHPLASYQIGKLKEKGKDIRGALEWYDKGATACHPQALIKVGDYFRAIWPKGSSLNVDYQKAHKHYKIAADQGSPKGLYRLGRMYESGKHVEQSLDIAAHLFYQACEKGHADAFNSLGALYNNPSYSGYDVEVSKYYLEWGKRFGKTKASAVRLLSYVGNNRADD